MVIKIVKGKELQSLCSELVSCKFLRPESKSCLKVCVCVCVSVAFLYAGCCVILAGFKVGCQACFGAWVWGWFTAGSIGCGLVYVGVGLGWFGCALGV